MLLSVVVSGVLGMAALIGFTLAIPDLGAIQQSSVPLADIAGYWLGPTLTTVFLAIVVFSMFALIVVAAASNSRLIFAMARDGLLPGSALLRRVNARTGTPVPALIASLVVCVVLLAFGTLEGDAFGVLVGATALVPYLVYLLTLGGYLARRKRLLALGEGGFRLGAWAVPVAGLAMLWLIAVVASLTLPEAFRGADYVVLAALALAGIWYVAVLRRRLATAPRGSPPRRPGEGVVVSWRNWAGNQRTDPCGRSSPGTPVTSPPRCGRPPTRGCGSRRSARGHSFTAIAVPTAWPCAPRRTPRCCGWTPTGRVPSRPG